MRTAFKEWAVVVDALGRGEQILILRKGGIKEGRTGFQVDHPKFFLFPTWFHQQRDCVIPSAQHRFDQIAPEQLSNDRVRIQFFAEVADWRRLESLEAAERLRHQHVWRDHVIAERCDWGKEKGIFVLAVRVHRLAKPADLPIIPSYGGCKSWLELEHDVAIDAAVPVLSEQALAEKLERFRSALAPSALASG